MALPYLIKQIYSIATEEVIRQGKQIFNRNGAEVASRNELLSNIIFRIRDNKYGTYYKVSVSKYDDPKQMSMKCTCSYSMTSMCKHKVAALLQLQDLIDKNIIGNFSSAKHDQRHTMVKMRDINLKIIKLTTGAENYESAKEILRTKKCTIISAKNDLVKATLKDGKKTYTVMIEKDDGQYFHTSCTCTDWDNLLCRHKTALFLQLLNNYGAAYFSSIKNWDRQKNKLLARYGYTLKDDWEGKFEFAYKDGKPFLRVLDRDAVKPLSDEEYKNFNEVSTAQPAVKEVEEETPEQVSVIIHKEVLQNKSALLFDSNVSTFPHLGFDLISGKYSPSEKKFKGSLTKTDLYKPSASVLNQEKGKVLISQLKKLQPAEIDKYLNRNSPFSEIWENIIIEKNEEFPEETKMLIGEFIYPALEILFEEKEDLAAYHLPKGKKLVGENLREILINPFRPQLSFEVQKEDSKVKLFSLITLEHQTFELSENEWDAGFLPLFGETAYLWKDYEDGLMAEKFRNPLVFSNEEWPKILEEVIIPLTKKYHVDFEQTFIRETKEGVPGVSIRLLERGDYLLFQPVFDYGGFKVKSTDNKTVVVADNNKVVVVKREIDKEEEIVNSIKSLHSSFVEEPHFGALALKGTDVLKNNWFFLFMDTMKEQDIPVYGFDALKNFRLNTARPTTNIRLSSGMDWFDAKVAISFGEQNISVKDIKTALANKQSFVQLGDGTLGILPEEWIDKYSLLFKVGETKKDTLRLSKYHLAVIDDLYEQRDNQEISFDLDEKFKRIRDLKDVPEIPAPEGLQHQLRPYQLAGFQWLNYLKEVGWGGILADDMGLGKTAQALSMILHLKNIQDNICALVICPTTLIYNWENEIKKFTPELNYLVHHGTSRTKSLKEIKKHNIIITTYGTLRSDIRFLIKKEFDYIVLDESQAIKNPFSKVTKAACLLQGKHRVCMSGTPLQNNTFDLYAQMNFLNPGLLGSVESFRNEFSNPIDKLGDREQKRHLKKILYPFILRRTKEQVAKDLPDKTEMVLYCEMEEKQRRIYELHRQAYRSKILGNIEEHGIGKSRLTILQGLMKLRQICDSPSILNDGEEYPKVSIKLEELSRELNENIGQHKVLIFSQFLGMLSLIKNQMKKDGIKYEYFDGSTSAKDREKAVQNFQSDDSIRAFVISLKAGGVGLNLTAADYVYIIDPWWNPAVEQQAIDRTHRIGQTKNIFAYRMICRNTIEDKILLLQDKKRKLAKDLITDDNAFVKNLTSEDIEYLFS